MRYHFHHPFFGSCHVAPRLSGKHGFALPKMFVIHVDQRPDLGSSAYHFNDRALRSVEDGRNEDALRMRVAIAQFLRSDSVEPTVELDTRIEPYRGAVLNAFGHLLSTESFHIIRRSVI